MPHPCTYKRHKGANLCPQRGGYVYGKSKARTGYDPNRGKIARRLRITHADLRAVNGIRTLTTTRRLDDLLDTLTGRVP